MGTVTGTRMLTPSGRSITLSVPGWPGSIAGQHVDVRLTAEDGYQAVRSYSLASVGVAESVELAVDRLPDGEVSPYLVDGLLEGDLLEVRGPLGGWFVWRPDEQRPVQLIGGGSGIVPLVSMLRAHAESGSGAPFRLLYSVKSPSDVFYADELAAFTGPHVDETIVYTRAVPAGWSEPPGRLTSERLAAAVIPLAERPLFFVCGPTAFVEAVTGWLVDLGYPADDIKAERFGG